MSRFIGAGLGFLGTDGLFSLGGDDRRLDPAWLAWHHDERIAAEVPYSYRSRNWPRSGLAGAAALLEGVWYGRPELTSGSPHSASLGPSGPVTDGGTIDLPLHKLAHVIIEGRTVADAPVDLESQRFFSRSPDIFTTGPAEPPDPDEAWLTPVAIGTGTLFIRADGDVGEGEVRLGQDVTVRVYAAFATQLVITFTGADGLPFRVPEGAGTPELPIGETATVTIEGRDNEANVVELTGHVFDDLGNPTFHVVSQDGASAIIEGDLFGASTLFISAVTGTGSEAVTLQHDIVVSTVAAVASHFVTTSALRDP